tara:strand:+ start:3580 stop:4134 length:555 start_codon:yes stop_codon:yes gene_type:complete
LCEENSDSKRIILLYILSGSILIIAMSFLFDQLFLDIFSYRNEFSDFLFGVVTHFGVVISIVLFLPTLFLIKRKNDLKILWLSFSSSIIASVLFKVVFMRIRPIEMVFPFKALSYSFPSLHTAVVFSVLPLLIKDKKYSKLFFGYAVLVAASRLYFSYHFLSDVVFGGFLGFFIGKFIINKVNK